MAILAILPYSFVFANLVIYITAEGAFRFRSLMYDLDPFVPWVITSIGGLGALTILAERQ